MKKRCKVCGKVKPLDDFYRAAGMKDGYRHDCKACNLAAKAARYKDDPQPAIERAKRWQAENRERHLATQRKRRGRPEVKARERDAHLRRTFNINQERYFELLAGQGGGCAVCGKKPKPGKSLHVDHDHATGEVRGLLCFSCNAALGHLRDDPVRIDALMGYVLDTNPLAVLLAEIEAQLAS